MSKTFFSLLPSVKELFNNVIGVGGGGDGGGSGLSFFEQERTVPNKKIIKIKRLMR